MLPRFWNTQLSSPAVTVALAPQFFWWLSLIAMTIFSEIPRKILMLFIYLRRTVELPLQKFSLLLITKLSRFSAWTFSFASTSGWTWSVFQAGFYLLREWTPELHK
jgi:hypothetical protein